MFPKLDPEVYPIEDDRQFFLELLKETRVMLVQGTGFNWATPDHFRIVFLPHEDDLREAINRIAKFLEQYRCAADGRRETLAAAMCRRLRQCLNVAPHEP
jgi:alanine-synthesizing transaminase